MFAAQINPQFLNPQNSGLSKEELEIYYATDCYGKRKKYSDYVWKPLLKLNKK